MAINYSQKTQTGCLILFCAPFIIIGVIVLGVAASRAVNPPVNWLNVFGLMAFGLTFSLAGGALLQGQSRARKQQAALAQKRQLYPESPWMWREDWSQGRVQSTTRTSMISTWVFALLWNLVSCPILFLMPRSGASVGALAVAMVFPLVGVILLFLAIRLTIRWEKFGKTWLDLTTLPGVIGKELRGAIHVSFAEEPEGGVQLKLTCVNRIVTGSGKNQSTNEKILWREECTVSRGQLHGGPMGSVVPVAFKIPFDALDTRSENPSNCILWIVQADAKMPGVDYQDVFEVPVFHTQDSRSGPENEVSQDPFTSITDLIPREKPLDTGIVVRPGESGGTEYDFSAARNIGAAFGASVFFFIWTGVVWFIIYMKAPLIFTIVFGAFDLIFLMIVLSQWLGTSMVTIGNGEVRVHSGLLGIGPTRVVPFSDITGISMPIGMQSGSRSGTPYYDIKIKRKDGKEVTLASAIRNKLEAEWLIAKMKSEIGLKS
jgi:hypothetical protein